LSYISPVSPWGEFKLFLVIKFRRCFFESYWFFLEGYPLAIFKCSLSEEVPIPLAQKLRVFLPPFAPIWFLISAEMIVSSTMCIAFSGPPRPQSPPHDAPPSQSTLFFSSPSVGLSSQLCAAFFPPFPLLVSIMNVCSE